MENYIVINGKKAELTEEQLKKLGINVEKKKETPFTKKVNEPYFYISISNNILCENDDDTNIETLLYDNVNYFNDKNFAKQVALHQLLYRKLLKYAYENDANNCDWRDTKERKYYICFDYEKRHFSVFASFFCKDCNVYFNNPEIAKQAITDVILPFMRDHSEFVW